MKKILLLLGVLLLGGCSAKFAYNNVNWLIYWYLDDYIELNNTQEEMFDGMLSRWMTWHKQQELPKYQLQLDDIINDIKTNNINEISIAMHRNRARDHWVRARGHIAPDLVTLGTTLSQDQIITFFANLEKENVEDEEELQERLALDPQKSISKWVKSNEKGIKKWLGNLSGEQTDFIATFYPRFESTSPFWLEYKRTYQQELRIAFTLDQNSEMFRARMLTLITDPDQFRSPAFQDAMQINKAASTEYLMGLMSLASDRQVKRLLEEIGDLHKDLQDLQE